MRYATITPPPIDGQAQQPWLIGDDSRRGPGSRFIINGWPSFSQVTQEAQYLDADFAVNLAHANRAVSITIQTEHEFADESQCFLFTGRMPLDCPISGALEIGTIGVGGGKVFYPYAVVESVVPISGNTDPTVVSMRFQYKIMVGVPSSSTGAT